MSVVLARFIGLGACVLSRTRFAAAFGVDAAGVEEVLPLCGSVIYFFQKEEKIRRFD